VAMLYQHHGLQPPFVANRRRGQGRRDKASKESAMVAPRGRLSGSSQCSSPDSIPSQPQTAGFQTAGFSQWDTCMPPMNYAENQVAPMSYPNTCMPGSFVHNTPCGVQTSCFAGGSFVQNTPCGAQNGCFAGGPSSDDVQSLIQNLSGGNPGSLLIMGPFPAPGGNVCAPTAPLSTACSNPKTKAIIKI